MTLTGTISRTPMTVGIGEGKRGESGFIFCDGIECVSCDFDLYVININAVIMIIFD